MRRAIRVILALTKRPAEQDSLRGDRAQHEKHAVERECELLVMGGYGHTRIRDFVLGGATEGVLNDLLLPVLLSH